MDVDRTYPCLLFQDVLVHAPLVTVGVAGIVGEDPLCADFLACPPAGDGHRAPRRFPARLHIVQPSARLAVLVRWRLGSFSEEEVSGLPIGLALL